MQNQGFTLPGRTPSERSAEGPLKRADPQIKHEDVVRRQQTDTPKPAAPSIPIQPDTGGWLTREQSANFLRVSVTTVANYERQGKLHPSYAYRADSRGIEHRVAVYDSKELVKLKRVELREVVPQEPGEIAARCFELFNQGMSVRDVVIEVRKTPEHVTSLFESWERTGSASSDLTITSSVKADFEQIVGPFSTIADLLECLRKLREDEHEPRPAAAPIDEGAL